MDRLLQLPLPAMLPLAEAARILERKRIARDLHDTLGYYLTALNLHLELAARQPGEATPESVRIARELGKELDARLRLIVGIERRAALDLPQALKTLCLGIPRPRIELTIDPGLELEDEAVSQALFRCAQEGITNAARHADAKTISISLSRGRDGIMLIVRDDGKGTGGMAEGSGLRGMRERASEIGGGVHIAEASEGGCEVTIRIPFQENRT